LERFEDSLANFFIGESEETAEELCELEEVKEASEVSVASFTFTFTVTGSPKISSAVS